MKIRHLLLTQSKLSAKRYRFQFLDSTARLSRAQIKALCISNTATTGSGMCERVQLKCDRGWKMPALTVKVDRITKFGNPFSIDRYGREQAVEKHHEDYG